MKKKNKESFIAYLCKLISEYFETTVANDDSDTLIANKAIDLSAASSVEFMAEDCDVLILLKHMVPGQLGIYSSQRKREATASKISLLTLKLKVMTLVAYGMFLYRRVANRIRTCCSWVWSKTI